MYQNCCKKCGSIALHTEVKGNNTGLYCDDCGAWVKWLGKDELRAFEYSMREASKEEIEATNFCDYFTIVERLERFVEGIDKEIDSEYEKRPISVEDNVRKNAYCYALEKCKVAIGNILDGREFDNLGE